MDVSSRVVGQTQSVGFQIGIRRTFPLNVEAAWALINSPAGVCAWLGEIKAPIELEDNFMTRSGEHGQISVYKENSHIRLTWKLDNWSKASTIQVRVIPNKDKTTIAFHQENLPGPKEREERHLHFKNALDKLEQLISDH
jgi:uncharacterized protein YndB with AHSA1/START domain